MTKCLRANVTVQLMFCFPVRIAQFSKSFLLVLSMSDQSPRRRLFYLLLQKVELLQGKSYSMRFSLRRIFLSLPYAMIQTLTHKYRFTFGVATYVAVIHCLQLQSYIKTPSRVRQV